MTKQARWRTASMCFLIAICAAPGLAQKLPPVTVAAPGQNSAAAASVGLDDLIRIGLERNPRLAQAGFAIDAASGKAHQAGLYPNPSVGINLDELGDRTGPGGVNTLPLVTQEIVTGRKLQLNRAAACREVDQATLALLAQRYHLLSGVRQGYYEVLALQRRRDLLGEMVVLAEQSIGTAEKLLAAKQVARLDVVQLEIELERLRADEQAVQRELPAAYRKLAARVGDPSMSLVALAGSIEQQLPDYDLEQARQNVQSTHPEVRSAEIGVDRARVLLRRAQVEPIPNVTVGAGYVRQNQNRSDDWTVGVSVPVPAWNRNQGNIRTAQAELNIAVQEVGRVQNELVEKLATAFRDYAAAKQRAERYRESILPKARESFDLALRAYQGGTFEYLRVLEAQRSITQANLEYVRALGDAWKAASEISGLLQEEAWPAAPDASR